ncbi:hypothetical protein HDU67_000508 [Dinochytrium kinnereticum]|nr:hypothetical protein HDU67_000508 [Dinochytrium kinnereticum]
MGQRAPPRKLEEGDGGHVFATMLSSALSSLTVSRWRESAASSLITSATTAIATIERAQPALGPTKTACLDDLGDVLLARILVYSSVDFDRHDPSATDSEGDSMDVQSEDAPRAGALMMVRTLLGYGGVCRGWRRAIFGEGDDDGISSVGCVSLLKAPRFICETFGWILESAFGLGVGFETVLMGRRRGDGSVNPVMDVGAKEGRALVWCEAPGVATPANGVSFCDGSATVDISVADSADCDVDGDVDGPETESVLDVLKVAFAWDNFSSEWFDGIALTDEDEPFGPFLGVGCEVRRVKSVGALPSLPPLSMEDARVEGRRRRPRRKVCAVLGEGATLGDDGRHAFFLTGFPVGLASLDLFGVAVGVKTGEGVVRKASRESLATLVTGGVEGSFRDCDGDGGGEECGLDIAPPYSLSTCLPEPMEGETRSCVMRHLELPRQLARISNHARTPWVPLNTWRPSGIGVGEMHRMYLPGVWGGDGEMGDGGGRRRVIRQASAVSLPALTRGAAGSFVDGGGRFGGGKGGIGVPRRVASLSSLRGDEVGVLGGQVGMPCVELDASFGDSIATLCGSTLVVAFDVGGGGVSGGGVSAPSFGSQGIVAGRPDCVPLVCGYGVPKGVDAGVARRLELLWTIPQGGSGGGSDGASEGDGVVRERGVALMRKRVMHPVSNEHLVCYVENRIPVASRQRARETVLHARGGDEACIIRVRRVKDGVGFNGADACGGGMDEADGVIDLSNRRVWIRALAMTRHHLAVVSVPAEWNDPLAAAAHTKASKPLPPSGKRGRQARAAAAAAAAQQLRPLVISVYRLKDLGKVGEVLVKEVMVPVDGGVRVCAGASDDGGRLFVWTEGTFQPTFFEGCGAVLPSLVCFDVVGRRCTVYRRAGGGRVGAAGGWFASGMRGCDPGGLWVVFRDRIFVKGQRRGEEEEDEEVEGVVGGVVGRVEEVERCVWLRRPV